MSSPITVAPAGFRLVSVGCENYVNLEWNKLTPPSGALIFVPGGIRANSRWRKLF